MLHRVRSKEQTRPITAPGPSYMTKEQVADYLHDLRTKRVPRPKGSRPLPSIGMPTRHISTTSVPEHIPPPVNITTSISRTSSSSMASASNDSSSSLPYTKSVSATHSRSTLAGSTIESSNRGRPLVRPPEGREVQTDSTSVPMTSELRPSVTYRESGQRWMERQEARSLREALHDMDMQSEARLHAAAQAEASELVWRHQNQGFPYMDAKAPRKYKEHLKEGSYARYQAAEERSVMRSISKQDDIFAQNTRPNDSSQFQNGSGRAEFQSSRQPPVVNEARHNGKVHDSWDSPQKKAYMNLTFSAVPAVHPRKSSGSRKASGGKGRKASNGSNQGMFKNPEDQIYEDPEIGAMSLPNAAGRSGASARPQEVKIRQSIGKDTEIVVRATSKAVVTTGRKSSLQESNGNFPSQKHNPGYVVNDSPAAISGSEKEEKSDSSEEKPSMKNGLEVRSEEIRSATSMRLRDRSPKLPAPTAVSDSPDRPIVSFDPNWQPKVESPEKQATRDHLIGAGQRNTSVNGATKSPVIGGAAETVNAPTQASVDLASNKHGSSSSDEFVPVIKISEDPFVERNGSSTTNIPSINVPDGPTISIDAPATSCDDSLPRQQGPHSHPRPLPTPNKTGSRNSPGQMPTRRAAAPFPDRNSSLQRHSVSCTQCGLAIAGRIVSAAGERFHPECFICYNCGEGLECVAFYPEPETKRAERLERIEKRARGLMGEEQDGRGEEDGDASLRFYCHLDYHELFSPRCKSCKTPIEGEVVVACGAEWHVGHFFCAQCGDPFDASTPFVEKDGYAWCVNCHTNRFSTKCKKCRKPVTDMVLKALGAEWHPHCFRCGECDGGFDDGRYFLRGDTEIPVCVSCEQKRLKA